MGKTIEIPWQLSVSEGSGYFDVLFDHIGLILRQAKSVEPTLKFGSICCASKSFTMLKLNSTYYFTGTAVIILEKQVENQHRQIKGYGELSADEIVVMNDIKDKGRELGLLVERLRGLDSVDHRWVSIGATDLQTGLMALTRAVAKPTFF